MILNISDYFHKSKRILHIKIDRKFYIVFIFYKSGVMPLRNLGVENNLYCYIYFLLLLFLQHFL